ncbi:hypothetical protein VNO80_02582 [Phaseolus coccineus]|uniref:Uncharacterized protein n=1 Tax=Phaseolus coccineus TaxID=3886 RepID=A0AAN9RMZ2_PHACN
MSLLLCWERKLSLIGTEQKVDALRSVVDIVGKVTDTGECRFFLSRKLQFRLGTIGFAMLDYQMFDSAALNV